MVNNEPCLFAQLCAHGPTARAPGGGYPAADSQPRARPPARRRETHLLAAHADGLPEHDPGHALQQRRRGQRARVGPVVQAPGEEHARVEASEGGALTLAQATFRLEPQGQAGGTSNSHGCILKESTPQKTE